MDWERWVADTDRDLDAMTQEIIRLQEQVKALERAQSRPDNAFWGQVIFDVGVLVITLLLLLLWRR